MSVLSSNIEYWKALPWFHEESNKKKNHTNVFRWMNTSEDIDLKLLSFNCLQGSFCAHRAKTLKFSFDYKKKKLVKKWN